MIPDGYTATPDGRIKGPSGEWVPLYRGRGGYTEFKFTQDGTRRRTLVHHVICEQFHGPKPYPAARVLFLDGDRTNTHPDNLQWGNYHDQVRISKNLKRVPAGETHYKAKLTWDQVREIRQRYAAGEHDRAALAADYPIGLGSLHELLRGQTWYDPQYSYPGPPQPPQPAPEPAPRTSRATASGAKLSWNDVQEIRSRAHAGARIGDLVAEYGVSKATISRIINNLAWHDPGYTPPRKDAR